VTPSDSALGGGVTENVAFRSTATFVSFARVGGVATENPRDDGSVITEMMIDRFDRVLASLIVGDVKGVVGRV